MRGSFKASTIGFRINKERRSGDERKVLRDEDLKSTGVKKKIGLKFQ